MPTINKPFLLKLVLVLVVAFGVLFGANALQSQRIPDALMKQSERLAETNDYPAAIRYLRQYIEFCPQDLDAQVRLAELIRKRDPNFRGSSELVFLHDKILREDPTREGVRRDALALALKMGRYTDAVPHAQELLKAHPTDTELWQQLAAAQTGMNQLPEARKSYENAVQHAPGEIRGYQRLAQFVWKNQRDTAGARTILDRMVGAVAMDPEPYLVRARFETFLSTSGETQAGIQPRIEQAIADLQRVLELDPENLDASYMLAEVLQKGRNVPAAHALLRETVSLYPKEMKLIRSLSWLELIRGNVPASIGVLEEGLRHVPDGLDLLVPLADLLVQQGDTVRTEEIVRRLEERKAPPLQVQYLSARLAMKQNRWPEAQAQLEALRTKTVNLPGLEIQVNTLLATCYQRVGDLAAEEKALKRIVDMDPANVQARVAFGTMLLNQGKFGEALQEFDAASQSPYAAGGVHSQRIRMHVRRLTATNGSAADWTKLEQATVLAAKRFSPVDPEPVILRADVASAQGKRADAVALLRAEAARRPGDSRLWAALSDAAADAGGVADGLAVLDEAQAAAGDGPEIRLARASLYARDPAGIRPIAALTSRTEIWPDVDQIRLLAGLVEIFEREGDTPAVVQMLRRLALRRSGDTAVWMRLHDKATTIGDTKAAAEARAALVKLEGEDGPCVLICEGLTASDGDAARQLERLRAKFGTSPIRADVCLALARLLRATGDNAAALQMSERALALEPTRFETNRSLLQQLLQDGSQERVRRELYRLAVDPRWQGEPYRRLVAMIAAELPPTDAPALLAAVPEFVRKEAGALGWLAECHAKCGNDAEASRLRQVAAKAPDATADDWLRLALHHARAKNAAELKDTFELCRPRVSSTAYFALTAAFVETPHAELWQPTWATPAEKRGYTQARLAVKLSRSVPREAVTVLEAFLTEKDQPEGDLAWCRRNLAMLLVISGQGPDDRRRAMTLIDEAELVKSGKPEELRATAAVFTTLCRYLEGQDRTTVLDRAISALTAACQSGGSPRDLFNLAQLYRVAGKPAESRECLNRLLQSDPDNLYYLVLALEILTDAEDFTSGAAFAERLKVRHGGEFRAVAAVARYEARAGQPERSLTLAEEYVRAAGPAAGDFLSRSARVAELLDELARLPKVRGTPVARRMTNAAVERYAALAPTRPEAAIAIAGLLASDARPAEAFAKLEQLHHYFPSRVRLLAGLAILRSGHASEMQFGTVRGWLEACKAEDTESLALKLSEAEYHALKQDMPQAERAYLAVLQRDPLNATALNNLAWLLATDPKASQQAEELILRAMREAGVTGELLDTRARIRITRKEFDKAEKDLTEAIKQGRTPLRLFHYAVLRMSASPPRSEDAQTFFKEARERGLDTRGIHPADLPIYRVLETSQSASARR